MASISRRRMIISLFADEGAAWAGIRLALDTGVPSRDIGLLTRQRGEVRVAAPVSESAGRLEGIGALLSLIATAIAGGVLPQHEAFLDQASNFTVDDVARISVELESGSSAVLILEASEAPPSASGAVQQVIPGLTELGGKVELHRVSDQAMWLAERRARPPRL